MVGLSLPRSFSSTSKGSSDQQLCPNCNSSVPGSYLESLSFTRVALPTGVQVRRIESSSPSVARYLLHHIVIEPVMHKIWLKWETCGKLLTTYFTSPDLLLAYSFAGLELDAPTLFMYTRSGPGGKLADTAKRISYFSRHADAVKEYKELIEKEGYLDDLQPSHRQLIWIVVEDNAQINMQLTEYMRNTSIRMFQAKNW